MKKLCFLPLFFLFTFCLAASPVLFQIQVENNTEPYLGIWFQKEKEAEPTYSRSPINIDGQGNFELEIPFEQIIRLQYGQKIIPVYVQLGEYPVLTFDATNLRNSIEFKGLSAAENNFMTGYMRLYSPEDKVRYELGYLPFKVAGTVSRQASSHSASQFFQHRDNQRKEALGFINEHSTKVKSHLLEQYKMAAVYEDLVNRITYFVVNQSRNSLVELLKLQETYPLNLEHSFSFSNEKLMNSPAYQNYLKAKLYYDFLPAENINERVVAPIIYDLAATKFSGREKYFLQSEILCAYLSRSGDAIFGQERYPKFFKENPYTQYSDKVEKVYGSDLNALTSKPAPLLSAITDKGELVTLQDYQGKVVYISFWASWCKPCLKGFETSKSVRKQLQDMGVILFNVSIDETKEAFFKSLERQNIIGINALATNLDETKIEYGLSTIPAYYIIDKNGKFAFLSENKGRNIVDEFKDLVNK